MTTPVATPQQIETTVFTALEQFGAEPSALRRDATLEELDVDSLDLVELAQIVEEEFGVKIANDDLASLQTVGDAIDFVLAKAS